MKLCIFGGTFDPIHKAHLVIAREAAEAYALDRVLFIPSANPPHKQAGATTDFEHRYRMVELACAEDPRFEPSRLEAGTSRSYSIVTIEKVQATLDPGDRPYFLIGADAFAEIGTWHRSRDVLEAVEFIVAARPGYEYPVPAGAHVHRLETVALGISSSEIRYRLEAGDMPEELPAPVAEYIRLKRLYNTSA